MFNLHLFILSITAIHLKYVDSERQDVRHMLYETFPSAISCFRLLNGTHQFGCSSDHSGNLGVIHFIKSVSDVDWLFSSKAVAAPYMAVVSPKIFSNKEVMTKLRVSNSISGILLAMNGTNDRPDSLSPDDTCPNRYSNLKDSCNNDWNPQGLSYLLEDWSKPIFFVNDVHVIEKIYKCFQKFNDIPDQSGMNLCSLQMKGHMFAAVNTPTCIYRSNSLNLFNPLIYCDAIGDRNIVNSLFPIKNPEPKSLIVVTTHLDVATMFDNLAPAAMSTVTGIVTLMATNHLLSKMIPSDTNFAKNVLFVMFSGEAYDYIGSSRAVYDMMNGNFPSKSNPIDFKHIGIMFEIGQLDKNKEIYVHYNNTETGDKTLFEKFNKSFSLNARDFSVSFLPSANSVMPSSIQSFLKENSDLPFAILANHDKHYKNKYYSSLMDNSSNIQYTYLNGTSCKTDCVQTSLAELSTAFAKSLYYLVTDSEYTGNEEIKPKLIDELIYCYLDNKQCQMFIDAFPYDKTPIEPSSLYVGVARPKHYNIMVTLTQSTLVSLTGINANKSYEECLSAEGEYQYLWITGKSGLGECFKSNSLFTIAISPAFELPDYDWSSGKYSTWTESVWQDLGLVMFLKPSRQHEIKTLSLGLVILVLSFVTVYWIKSRASFLFHTKPGMIC